LGASGAITCRGEEAAREGTPLKWSFSFTHFPMGPDQHLHRGGSAEKRGTQTEGDVNAHRKKEERNFLVRVLRVHKKKGNPYSKGRKGMGRKQKKVTVFKTGAEKKNA